MNGNEIINVMAQQINARELKFAKFKLLADNDKNQITVVKGQKWLKITYNEGSDLYDVQKGRCRKYEIYEDEVETGYYADQLRDIIQSYFPNFEYVMDSIKIVGVNC